jgi:leucyl aminopeptidase
MKFETVSKLNLKSTTQIVFVTQNTGDKKSKATWHSPKVNPMWYELAEQKVFQGAAKEVLFLRGHGVGDGSDHTLLVGLGKDFSHHETWRQAGASAFKSLSANKITKVTVNFDFFKGIKGEQGQAFIEGFGLANYRFEELKTKKSEAPEMTLQVHAKHIKNMSQHILQAETLVESVNLARRLGDLPGNFLTPTALAEEVVKMFKGTSAKVTIWNKKRIEKERLGGLLAVAKGSHQEPRFIKIEYKGGKAKDKPVVLVGKGLTFDTGGISLKPSGSMEEMKFDMCGAAAVIGAMYAIVKSKLKANVTVLVSATENMPGGSATKPGDVYTARNGKTVEVNNTDAEGRLILGEALVVASELKPKWIVDAATLTGAMVVALGNLHTGYFTRSKEFKKQIEKAAEYSGEWVWNLPLCDQHVEDMKGTFADLNNISSGKGAGSATAAAFLEQFVGEGITWAHFDIAGTAWAVGNRLNYCSAKGASGVMVRTFFELVKSET